MFTRSSYQVLRARVHEPRRFIQVLRGPRQTGKTTLARQVMDGAGIPSHYASCDEPGLKDGNWLAEQWERARLIAPPGQGALLVLDEIQKIPGWSDAVKRLWDEDTLADRPLRVFLLGSSALLVQRGLSETLAGRYEVTHITHWSFPEMRDAFCFDWQEYVYFGGYPGAAALRGDHHRWSNYVAESLIEPTISRDILMMNPVGKPALLRQLFDLGCAYSGQVLSYQKMLGQLHDAGNTTTLAHYLELLEGAGLLSGLKKHAGDTARRRASSPKLLVLNTALMSTASRQPYHDAVKKREFWGRLSETAVGAALKNGLRGTGADLRYWAGRNREVDFVISNGDTLVTVEVKSGRRRTDLPGVAEFSRQFRVRKNLLVGGDGIPFEEFFSTIPELVLD